MFVKPRSRPMVSSSVRLAFVMDSSTEVFDARPWWHCRQRASGPRPVISAPEGNVTLDNVDATGLGQASHWITVPTGAGWSTLPASLPSAPMKSWKPGVLWHRAQSGGTSGGLASFQSLKARAVLSACGEPAQASSLGITGTTGAAVTSTTWVTVTSRVTSTLTSLTSGVGVAQAASSSPATAPASSTNAFLCIVTSPARFCAPSSSEGRSLVPTEKDRGGPHTRPDGRPGTGWRRMRAALLDFRPRHLRHVAADVLDAVVQGLDDVLAVVSEGARVLHRVLVVVGGLQQARGPVAVVVEDRKSVV